MGKKCMRNKNVLIANGGGPTAVLNSSLYGLLKGLKNKNFGGTIYAARFGSKGLAIGDLIALNNLTDGEINMLKFTPGSSIGSTRYPTDYEGVMKTIVKNNIGYVFFVGGNGSMNTLGNIKKHAKEMGLDLVCVGVPKTVDNDVCVTDHAPGYASAATFIINAVSDCAADVKGMPIHVSVIEVMGRNAGWLTASSVLARKNKGDAPHLIYCPEIPFNEDQFLKDVKKVWDKGEGVVVVCSEGLKDENGKEIVEPIYEAHGATYYGDVSTHLATLVIKKLGIKARSEKFGLIQRCSTKFISKVDQKEAVFLGKKAAELALNGKTGVMVGLKRVSNNPYKTKTILIPLEEVMQEERKFPLSYIKNNNDISDNFIQRLKPLVDLPQDKIFLTDKK